MYRSQERAQLPLLFAGDALIAVADLWLDESRAGQRAQPRAARGSSGTRD